MWGDGFLNADRVAANADCWHLDNAGDHKVVIAEPALLVGARNGARNAEHQQCAP